MKVFQFIILAAIVALFLGLAGCDKTDGQIELKEPRMELEDMPKGKDWFATPISQQPAETEEE